MANGEKVHEGAVAYNDVPLGTKVVIDGKTYTVKDRMADNGVVDIYMNSIKEALKHGRKSCVYMQDAYVGNIGWPIFW